MPTNSSGAAVVLTATQFRGLTVGVAVAMTTVGVAGLTISMIADEEMPPLRIAYIGCFAGLLVFGQVILIVATLRGLASVIRHQAAIEQVAIANFDNLASHQERLRRATTDHFTLVEKTIDEKIDDGVQDRLDQIEHLMVKAHALLTRQADVIGEVVERQIQLRDDELGRRRNRSG